jgi:hypothetical protein
MSGAFVAVQWKAHNPVDLRLFHSLFDVNLITGFITFVCMAGTIILSPSI